MKVLLYGDHVFSIEVARGFSDLGHDAKIINPGTAKELEQQLLIAEPEIFMTLGTPAFYRVDMLNAIGKKPSSDTIYIHWDTDGVLWEHLEINIISQSKPDIVFTICPVMQQRIAKIGMPCYMLPFASNPQMHHPAQPPGEYEGKITFVGNWYRTLAETAPDHLRHKSMEVMFKPLLESGREIHFYGANAEGYPFGQVLGLNIPCQYLHRHVPYEHIHKVYSGSFINLVPQNYEHSIIKRAFEILSGGFGLSYDTPAMREAFPDGCGFVYTSSHKETLDIVDYFSHKPEAYNRVRENALSEAQKHTYKQRAETIISRLRLSSYDVG
jgi:spore maturation protein CgeB